MKCSKCGKELLDYSRVCIDCANQTLGLYNNAIQKNEPAGFWLRFVAWIIDTTIINLIVYLIAYISILIFGVNFINLVHEIFLQIGLKFIPDPNSLLIALLFSILGAMMVWMFTVLFAFLLFGYIYAVWFETSKYRATPGKLILGLEILDAEDQTITIATASIRHLSKTLFIFTFGISYIIAAFTPQKQALHDLIAKCYIDKGPKYSLERLWIGLGVALVCIIVFMPVSISINSEKKIKPIRNNSTVYYSPLNANK